MMRIRREKSGSIIFVVAELATGARALGFLTEINSPTIKRHRVFAVHLLSGQTDFENQ